MVKLVKFRDPGAIPYIMRKTITPETPRAQALGRGWHFSTWRARDHTLKDAEDKQVTEKTDKRVQSFTTGLCDLGVNRSQVLPLNNEDSTIFCSQDFCGCIAYSLPVPATEVLRKH